MCVSDYVKQGTNANSAIMIIRGIMNVQTKLYSFSYSKNLIRGYE